MESNGKWERWRITCRLRMRMGGLVCKSSVAHGGQPLDEDARESGGLTRGKQKTIERRRTLNKWLYGF